MEISKSNRAKRLKTENVSFKLKVNDIYVKNMNLLSEAFCKKQSLVLENEAKVITDPFTCCVLPDFIVPEDYLKELKDELSHLEMLKKINDLYQFEQSKDLGDCTLPHVSSLKKLFKSDVLDWMKNVTKIPLVEKIDISCSCYTFTDHLLCHDDELEGRRIAFILYLVPEWTEKDGGTLDLFETVDGQPSKICKSLIPKWNSLIFFEVSPISYHQVSEVLSSKKRIALSGWFHGPPLKPSVPIKENILYKEPTQQEIDITEWINPVYMDGSTLLEIRETFEDSSEISLPDFLQTKKYEEVCKALADTNIVWEKKGPANRRNIYETNSDENIPAVLKECQALFNSEAFLVVLSNLTALKLHPMCDNNTKLGKVFSTIRKWCHGSYSLLHDQSFSQRLSLNAIMYFGCPEWDPESGGYSSFVALDENEELLRVEPSANSLALVYVTEETSHFVKYINSKSKENSHSIFYDIYCSYLEDDTDDSGRNGKNWKKLKKPTKNETVDQN